MTDATTGSGTEGAPRDGKTRGRATVPAAAPGRDPVTGEKVPGNVPTTGADIDTGHGRDTEPGAGAASRGRGGLGGETTTGRDGVPDPAGTPGSHGPSGTTGDAAPLVTGSDQSHGTVGTEGRGTNVTTSPGAGGAERHGTNLLPSDESDKLAQRLQHAVAGFVDEPKHAVEEADHVLEEAAARFTDAVTQRRRTLRNSWEASDGGAGRTASATDTEQLRLALRDYRELAERLLHI
ncbi:hypothetical protein [Streptomyces resistomycificus]|uniref:hypothetical protein n=1 Tax=Streptomyces resistomycificus TaxID=67356 RepID=UPI0004AA8855|nr:hypothetical protein [Streptomyces resistomycificus]